MISQHALRHGHQNVEIQADPLEIRLAKAVCDVQEA